MDQDQYIKLFNYGYFLSKNEPKLLSKLLNTTKENKNFHEPLLAGDREFKREQLRAKMNHLSKDQDRSQDQGYDR